MLAGNSGMNKYISGDWPPSTHAAHVLDESASARATPAWPTGQLASAHASASGPRASRFIQFWASGGAKLPKMCDFLPWTPMNCHAKFDAASFILARKIRNRTNTHTHKQTVTNNNRHFSKQFYARMFFLTETIELQILLSSVTYDIFLS